MIITLFVLGACAFVGGGMSVSADGAAYSAGARLAGASIPLLGLVAMIAAIHFHTA